MSASTAPAPATGTPDRTAQITLVYGLFMLFLGIGGYVATGMASRTPLMASGGGALALLCAGISLWRPALTRIFMHIAVVLVFLMAAPTSWRFTIAIQDSSKTQVAIILGLAAGASWAMLGAMIMSFLKARRARTATT